MAGSIDFIEFDLHGMPECLALLRQFEGRELNNRMRRALRAGVAEFRTEMRSQARSRPDLPKTFRKTRTRAHRTPLGVSVSPKSPLSNIFEHGAGSHVIAPKNKPVLFGRAGERGRKRQFYAPGPVRHPGVDARPFIGPVFDAAEEDAKEAFTRVLFEGVEL